MSELELKTCSECGEAKPIDQFPFRSRTRKDGSRARNSRCADCLKRMYSEYDKTRKEQRREYYESHKARYRQNVKAWRERNRKQRVRKYGAGANEFRRVLINNACKAKRRGYMPCSASSDDIEAAYSGTCHLCGKTDEDNGKMLSLDYDHSTGKFRGWVCARCKAESRKRLTIDMKKECIRKQMQRWRKRNRYRLSVIQSRTAARRNGWPIPMASAEDIKAAFTGKCHVCGVEEVENGPRLFASYSRHTGKFLGWQCNWCRANEALALMEQGDLVTSEVRVAQ